MSFGYPLNGKLIINARAETVFEKKLFKDAAVSRRVVIPVSGFYEWNQDKEKFTFKAKDGGLLFFAGLFDIFNDKTSFVIITTEANDSMQPVHDRMPLIVPKDKIGEWFSEDYRNVLSSEPVSVKVSVENEQMTFL
jgi:putative SOS response-associated peptidase YedK